MGDSRVILDLSSVKFIDSSGLGAIVAAMKQLGSGRRLDLAGLTPVVEKVFRLTPDGYGVQTVLDTGRGHGGRRPVEDGRQRSE